MKVTKYPQSCLVIEGDGRLLIDPGNYAVDAYSLDDFGPIDGVLYTHRHADHYDERLLDPLRERGAAVFGNADVASLIGEGCTAVSDGERFEAAGFSITAHDLPHCVMVDGSAGPPNTGFLIDDAFFHPGDGVDIRVRAKHLAVPIAGPSISFRDAYLCVERTGAERVLPIHYDSFIANPERFVQQCGLAEVVVLGHGESADF